MADGKVIRNAVTKKLWWSLRGAAGDVVIS